MENIIPVIVLIVILVPAVRHTYLRLSGKKSCCGGSGNVVEKKLEDPIVETYRVNVEGMHCDNCKNSIMRDLNRLDGVSASVSLAKKLVTISCSKEVDADVLKSTIEKLDFSVVDIQKV